MSSSLDTSVDLNHYLRMFWRRKGIVALCAITVVCAAVAALEFVPREYEARAALMIEDRQPLSNQLESVLGGMRRSTGGYRADEKRMDKLMGRVRSRPFLERVVQLLRMDEDPGVQAAAREALERRPGVSLEEMSTRVAVNRLQSKIGFGQKGTGIYEIIVTDTDPENAYLLSKWISELFVDVSLQNSLEELRMAHEFGAEQLKIYEEQLERSERALQQYMETVIEQDLDKSVVGADNIALAENLYERVLDEAELARVRVLPFARTLEEAGLEAERSELLNDPRVVNQARALTSALEEELTKRLVSERRGADSDWPPTGAYVALRRGLFQLIERSAAAANPDLSGDLQDALARYVFSTVDREAHADAAEFLGQSISDFRRQAQAEPKDEMEIARLESEIATNRELLRSFQAQLVASDVSQAMEMTNLGMRIEILEPPEIPLAPTRPNRAKILAAAVLLGPLLGLGIALVIELMDPTLRSISEFRRVFDGPVLGTPPLVDDRIVQEPRGVLRRYWIPATVTGVVLVTALFLVFTRSGMFDDVAPSQESVQIVDPEQARTP